MSHLPPHPETVRVPTQMPAYYPNGLPLYWMDETSGVLPSAMRAFILYRAGDHEAPAPEEI